MKDNVEKEKKKIGSSKTMKVISFRNRFLYIFYRFSLLIFLCSLILAIFSTWFFVYFLNKPIPPQYIPIDHENRLMPLPTIDINNKTTSEIIDFAVRAVKKLHTYDYINYSEQIQDASYFFIESEWNAYLDGLAKAKTIDYVKLNQAVVSVKISGAPSIVRENLNKQNNSYTWIVDVPVNVSYFGKENTNIQQGVISMLINRISLIRHPEGIAIKQIVFNTGKDKK